MSALAVLNFDCALTANRYGVSSITRPTHAARRGAYVLPHQPQQLGRDLEGERFVNRPRTFYVYELREAERQRRNTPYVWLVQTECHTSATAFVTAGELLDWCRAYSITRAPALCHFADFVATTGDPADWLPLTVEPVRVQSVQEVTPT